MNATMIKATLMQGGSFRAQTVMHPERANLRLDFIKRLLPNIQ
jgi:hypothetical protein